MLRVFFFLLLAGMAFTSCRHDSTGRKDSGAIDLPASPASAPATAAALPIRHTIIPSSDGSGFGYDIYMDDKLYIHQPDIPAISGTQGFSTKEKAEQAARLVEDKIRNNIRPPAVSIEELDSIGVLK